MKYGKKIGLGNTATVYEWEERKVLKLFHKDYPKEAVEKEFQNAKSIWDMDFAKPKAHEIIFCEGKIGIVYDKLEGESLLDWVMKTGDVEGCAVHMADLHKKIIQNRTSDVPSYKEFLKSNIVKARNLKEKEKALHILDKLPNGNTLCHGDFHPGNIFIWDGHTMAIDFMNICHGHFLYDIARTTFLIEYTPVPVGIKDKEMILQLKKSLSDLYLMQMNVTREMIRDYLLVIIAGREAECPNER